MTPESSLPVSPSSVTAPRSASRTYDILMKLDNPKPGYPTEYVFYTIRTTQDAQFSDDRWMCPFPARSNKARRHGSSSGVVSAPASRGKEVRSQYTYIRMKQHNKHNMKTAQTQYVNNSTTSAQTQYVNNSTINARNGTIINTMHPNTHNKHKQQRRSGAVLRGTCECFKLEHDTSPTE